jgi:hypothetical protein
LIFNGAGIAEKIEGTDDKNKSGKIEDTSKPPYTPDKITPTPSPPATKRNFYASIELNPIQSKKQFADLVDEVVMQFTSHPGVKVKIAIEIRAESETGFDDGLQRAVKENCTVLKFKSAEFESGD